MNINYNLLTAFTLTIFALGCKVEEVQRVDSEDQLFPDNLTDISGPIGMLDDSQLEQYCEGKSSSSTLSSVRKYFCVLGTFEESQPESCPAAVDECLLNSERVDQSQTCGEREDNRYPTESCSKELCLDIMKDLRDDGCKGDILEYGQCERDIANGIISLSNEALCNKSASEISDLVSEDFICIPGDVRDEFCDFERAR